MLEPVHFGDHKNRSTRLGSPRNVCPLVGFIEVTEGASAGLADRVEPRAGGSLQR